MYSRLGKNPSLYINADDMVKAKVESIGLDINALDQRRLNQINLEIALEADQLRQTAINARQSFVTETVMSTPAKIDLMRQARAKGFDVHLVYVTTQSPSININRVSLRVKEGGHDVPAAKVSERYNRAIRLLPSAIQAATSAFIYNNSFENPLLVMEKTAQNELHLYPAFIQNQESKWTPEKLEEIRTAVHIFDQQIKAIEAAPLLEELDLSASPQERYAAYAKSVLAKSDQVWTHQTDKEVAIKMLKSKSPIYVVKETLAASPALAGIPEKEKQLSVKYLLQSPDVCKHAGDKGQNLSW